MIELLLGAGALYALATKKPLPKTKASPAKPATSSGTSQGGAARSGSPQTQTAVQPWAQPVAQARSDIGSLGQLAVGTGTIVQSLSSIWGTIGANGSSDDDSESVPPPTASPLPSPDWTQSNVAGNEDSINSDDGEDYTYDASNMEYA